MSETRNDKCILTELFTKHQDAAVKGLYISNDPWLSIEHGGCTVYFEFDPNGKLIDLWIYADSMDQLCLPDGVQPSHQHGKFRRFLPSVPR
jgi:hypothetical protein